MSLKEVKMLNKCYCDFCKPKKVLALYDGKTKQGSWAYMCQEHFKKYGTGLGEGKGQKLIYTD